MQSTIKVEYLGTTRLLIQKKHDIYCFSENPTLRLLVDEIGRRYGEKVKRECLKQIFVLYISESDMGKSCRLPGDENILLEKISRVKILNALTGG